VVEVLVVVEVVVEVLVEKVTKKLLFFKKGFIKKKLK